MADTPPASSGGEGELEFGREMFQGRDILFVSGPDAKRWFPMSQILPKFFLGPGESRSVVQRRMNDLGIERVLATKEQVDLLHRGGLHVMSSRIKLVMRDDLVKLLSYRSRSDSSVCRTSRAVVEMPTPTKPEPLTSVEGDSPNSPETNNRMRRVMAMLKSNLVGRDVNCIQPSWRDDGLAVAQPTSGAHTSDTLVGERHRAAGHVTGTTRTRIVKRPRRHDGFISLDGGADSTSDSDGGEGRCCLPAKKKKRLGHSRTVSCSGLDDHSDDGDDNVLVDLGVKPLRDENKDLQSMKVVLRREYTSDKRSTWVKCPDPDKPLPNSTGPVTTPLNDVGAQAQRQQQAPPKQQSQAFAARKTVSGQQKSTTSLRKGKNFSLAQAIPCPPVLLVHENDLVPACSCVVNISDQGLPPPCHPLWSWSVGQSVNKEYLIKTTDVAWRNRSVVVRRRQQ